MKKDRAVCDIPQGNLPHPTEPTIAELCAPLSATVQPARLNLLGEAMTEGRRRTAEAVETLSRLRRRKKYGAKRKARE